MATSKEYQIISFRDVNFHLRDILYYTQEELVDYDRLTFEIHQTTEHLYSNVYEIYFHVLYRYEYSTDEKEIAEEIELLHTDFLCLFKYGKRKRKIPNSILISILEEIVSLARGYLLSRTQNLLFDVPVLPDIDIKKDLL